MFYLKRILVNIFICLITKIICFRVNSLVLGRIGRLRTSILNKSLQLKMSTSLDRNPLLSNWYKKEHYGIPPFSLVEPYHFKPAILFAMKLHLEEISHIVNRIPSSQLHDDIIVRSGNENINEESNFYNVIEPLDRAGGLFKSITNIFYNLCSSHTNPELQKVELELSTILAAHKSKIYTYPKLFEKIELIYNNRHKSHNDHNLLNSEQIRLIERFYLDFVRAGAKFDKSKQDEYSSIMEKLAKLQTQFGQNVLADESEITIELTKNDLEGCPESLISSMKQAAMDTKNNSVIKADTATCDEDATSQKDNYVLTLSRSLMEPFLTFSSQRHLREKAFLLWSQRGELDKVNRDNNKIAVDILKLRHRQAELHNYKNYAEYQISDTMAKKPENVMSLLEKVWVPAKKSVGLEENELQDYITRHTDDTSVGNNPLKPWDWRYYAEKVRKEKYDFDESLLKPYLSLTNMQTAVFDCAYRLYGLKFIERKDIALYHPDVQLFEVYEEQSVSSTGTVSGSQHSEEEKTTSKKSMKLVALFLHDNYTRKTKRSGAWMSEYRSQTKNSNEYIFKNDDLGMLNSDIEKILGSIGTDSELTIIGNYVDIHVKRDNVIPIVVNNNNFAKGGDSSSHSNVADSTLLSFDEAITLFHEFGHGLHGMLSNVHYSRLASTNVLKDFVELPSQLMEHWLRSSTEALTLHGKHYQTKEVIPIELLNKLKAARNFNQGFATIEYTVCAIFDLLLHSISDINIINEIDLSVFEKTELTRLGMPSSIIMRHRPAHFQHLFASSSYSSAYYVYLYAEVLDADAFDAFLESKTGCFDKETAERVRKYIYSVGNSIEPGEAFRLFRGRDPDIIPMLKKKGLYENA